VDAPGAFRRRSGGAPRSRRPAAGRVPGERRDPEPLDPSWADAAAAIAVAAFAVSAFALRSSFTDFVYHWGLKGHRFFLTHGIDEAFLARPENGYLHPDYPNLLPELFAAAALLAGRFDPRALMLFSPILPARAARRGARASATARALPACAPDDLRRRGLRARRVLHRLPAGRERRPALRARRRARRRRAAAPVGRAARSSSASPPPSQRRSRSRDCRSQRLRSAPSSYARRVARAQLLLRDPATWIGLLAPTLLVAVPWAFQVRALGLFQGTNTGSLDLGRVSEILAPLWRQAWIEEWLGLPLLLAALPLVALTRATRWLGLLLLAQLAFYLFAYLSAPFDPNFYVLSTFPRLALHLLPATVVGLALALAGPHDPPKAVA
jgi:hypothetical protein